jgi:hypothetical protein
MPNSRVGRGPGRHHAKQPDRREHERGEPEARRQQCASLGCASWLGENLVHRLRAPERDVRIRLASGGA